MFILTVSQITGCLHKQKMFSTTTSNNNKKAEINLVLKNGFTGKETNIGDRIERK